MGAAGSTTSSSGANEFFEANSAIILIGVTIVLVAIVTWILVRVARKLTARVAERAQSAVERSEEGTASHDNAQRLVRRVRTMSALVTNVIVWVQVIIAVAIIFAILGVNVAAIVASAGVIAAALTFSAQTLLKDIITGLFLIAEDQLDVGDVVDVGYGLGVVESVSLRVTQVRAFDGYLWSVRNGEILRTSNRSRGWVRLILEVDFAPAVDIDRARTVVLAALGDALAAHAAPKEVQEEPSCWGLSAFSNYGYRLKFLVAYAAVAFDRLDAAMREAVYRAIAEDPELRLAVGPVSGSPVCNVTADGSGTDAGAAS